MGSDVGRYIVSRAGEESGKVLNLVSARWIALRRSLGLAATAAALAACATDRSNQETKTSVDVTKGDKNMNHVALLVRLESKPGKEADVEAFLKGGLPIVEGEPETT